MNWLEKYPWSIIGQGYEMELSEVGTSWFDNLDTWCPGWIGIITEFADRVTNLLNDHIEAKITILQIKEKYGELRFYASAESEDEEFHDRFNELMDDLEDASKITCMRCGNNDTAKTRPRWDITYCDDCWARIERR